MTSRREFLKNAAFGTAALASGVLGVSAKSYTRILGSNDRLRIGLIGYSERARDALIPSFLAHNKAFNAEIVAISDIWKLRREEGGAFLKEKAGKEVDLVRNNDELFERKLVDAVILSTADFQHALHGVAAVRAGLDAYIEKPLAESMADAHAVLKAVNETKAVVQIGSQRRSAWNYIAAFEYLKSGKFGPITMVEMTWNVNEPSRWRRPRLVAALKEEDTDWSRYLLGKTQDAWDPRKYIEYRLFWPYSSGIPGQWMSHQIDTVHWFSGLSHPRSVVANGGVYVWKDGRTNADTLTAVFDYGPPNDPASGFQVVYSSRMHNSAGGTKELYYSNGGTLDLDANRVTPEGGLGTFEALSMGIKPNLVQKYSLSEGAKPATPPIPGLDEMTSAHMRNWLECVRSRKTPNADIVAGYNHSIAVIMVTAAMHTGERVTFDAQNQEVLAGGKAFR